MPHSADNLCVDLDGTLIRSDSLWELVARALRKNPFYLALVPLMLARGRAFAKRRLAEKFGKFAERLPVNPAAVSYIKKRKKAGAKIWLVTACDEKLAEKIAARTGLFDGVYGSSETINLKGENKAALCSKIFGDGNFDYMGDSPSDIPVWEKSRTAAVVGGEKFAEKIRRRLGGKETVRIGGGAELSASAALRAVRAHQWAKNLLVFVALISSHRYFNLGDALNSAAAFLAFCFCASATYILNDLLDIESDRLHPSKRSRPFASGDFPIPAGIALMLALAAAAVAAAAALPREFALALAAYAAITIGYSFAFKRVAFVDVAVLACLYYLRVLGGGEAIDCKISFWLSAFSVFLFLGLALLKRCVELSESAETARARGYGRANAKAARAAGIASCALSVAVYAVYTQRGARAYYENPDALLLGTLPIGFFLWKIWRDAARGLVSSDPLVYTLKTKSNYVLLVVFIVVFALSKPF